MRIAQIGPLFESVPPKLYGGTERVVSYLTEALIKLGHEVTLFASEDSVTSAKLIPICPKALRLNGTQDSLACHVLEMEQVYKRAQDFDIIHNHNDYIVFPLARRCKTPTVTTLHGRLDIKELLPLYKEYFDIPLVSISLAQRTPLPFVNWVGNVYHGLPEDLYIYNEHPEDYLAFVGRLSPEKKVDAAIDIAIKANKKIKIAAKFDENNKEYYENTIKSKLNHPLVEYVGEIKENEKSAFIGKASAFLFPIDWSEPFGLVLIESIACGTPLIARRRGSIPEVVEEGVNGFIFENDNEAVDAINKIAQISREKCRKVFEDKYTDIEMALGYIKIYQKLINQRKDADSYV